jgi:hypothetical protein
LTEQEIQELAPESGHEIDADTNDESEAEAEGNPEEVAAEAFEHIEGGEAGEHEHSRRFRGVLARFVLRHVIKAILVYIRIAVRRMHRHATLRRKLIAATRRGPRALRALVGPVVLRTMPRPFRRAARRLVPLLVGLSFRFIARTAGLSTHEADAAECESES